MRRFRLAGPFAAVVLAGAWARPATAHPTYYSSYCAGCHGSSVQTCNGCHSHGTHSGSTKSDINVAGALDRSTYAPGATITVMITGGYQSGWIRALLFDESMNELARSTCPGGMGGCTTTGYPVTLTATAPATPGTYTWAVAWYGNYQYEGSGASFGNGTSSTLQAGSFTPDPHNANHGYQVVALPAFTVTASATPAMAIAPTALAFGTVSVGASSSKTFVVSSTGTATLTGSVARASGTSAEYTVSPATFSLAPGGSQLVTVTYTPVDTVADTGSIVVTSNDSAHPSGSVSLTGVGTTVPLPAIALSPAALDLGTVNVGASSSRTAQIQNTGAAALTVASVARCTTPATSDEFAWTTSSAQPLTIAAGQSATITVSYDPIDVGADAGCLVITSTDPQNPTAQLVVGGTGAQPPAGVVPRTKGGCSTGEGAGGATALLSLLALRIRARGRRRRGEPCTKASIRSLDATPS
jgi:Abnormal spindle-like microcephaly-assoc'd, ASPM-SPD-2-Hydin/HYDIN/CFA65/VesB-like, Ig-like domain